MLCTLECLENLAFNSLCPDKHPNKFRNIFAEEPGYDVITFNKRCSVCIKVTDEKKAIPCPTCNHLVHKTCSNLNQSQIINFRRSKNIWECPKCAGDKFPYAELEDDEILLNSFNSNWNCKCKHKNVQLPTDESVYQES